MKGKKFFFVVLTVLIAAGMLAGAVLADDSIMLRRNISKTPESESEKAGLAFMPFTVPAQASDGTLLETIDYITEDESTVYSSTTAKPLIVVYIDDIHHELETSAPTMVNAPTGGLTFGMRDTFVGHSLDDGETWKTMNVSKVADLSSFKLANGTDYPGDSFAAVHAVAGNRVMAAWLSRYCDGGTPLYTLAYENSLMNEEYVDYMQTTYDLPDLYLQDIWGVAGTQKSVDFTLQGFPEVGEIPYGCVWTARGTLVQDADAGTFDIVWTKAERVTSGARDPNRLEVDGVKGAGFVITWQEDPEGLRPGLGLGPGEGWSGAIVNSKTDVWYSYVGWDDFGLVDEDGDLTTFSEEGTLDVEQYVIDYPDGAQPKPAVPMAMPVRITDNNMCKSADNLNTTGDQYCYAGIDFVTGEITPGSGFNSTANVCTASVSWTNPGGTTMSLCQAPDGRVLNGRVGASRPRISLQPYTKADGTTSAWYIMGYEETKALGDILIDGTEDPIEIGKNIWYHTFDMFHPEVIQQGGMLNQPSVFNPETNEGSVDGVEFLSIQDEFDNTVYQTEIARRFSFMAQPVAKIGEYRTSAYLLYKQGILNQGGPADIFARWTVAPPIDDPLTTDVVEGTFDPQVDNPYLFKYMPCDNWIIEPGASTNPNYLEGLCGAPATSLSANTIVACDNGTSGADCAASFPWDGGTEDFPKVSEWDQSVDNLDDQSYENPFDVGKGHRGFIAGDYIMVLYAWSPNWKANSVGNDKYNLYVRRSFDGGATWTTTPAALGGTGIDGDDPANPVCENFGIGGQEEDITTVCYDYAAGEFERARNVSLLTGTKVTILDPRYTPTGGLKKFEIAPYVDEYLDTTSYLIETYDQNSRSFCILRGLRNRRQYNCSRGRANPARSVLQPGYSLRRLLRVGIDHHIEWNKRISLALARKPTRRSVRRSGLDRQSERRFLLRRLEPMARGRAWERVRQRRLVPAPVL